MERFSLSGEGGPCSSKMSTARHIDDLQTGMTERANLPRADCLNYLTLELRKLEQAGIVTRTARDGLPPHVDYGLSDSGRSLVPLVDALGDRRQRTQAARQPAA